MRQELETRRQVLYHIIYNAGVLSLNHTSISTNHISLSQFYLDNNVFLKILFLYVS